MKRWSVLMSLLLPGLICGCASETEVRRLQQDASSLQRLSSTHYQTMETRLQQLSERVAKFEQAQAATRRDVAQAAAQADELQSLVRRLQGAVQETQNQMQGRATGGEDGAASTLTNVETRIRTLEQQLPASSP